MKTLTAALAMSAALFAAGAQAADNIEPNDTPFQGVYGQEESNAASRAQIAAELAQAKATGLVSNVEPNSQGFDGAYASSEPVGKTRAQVTAELAQAKARGLVSNIEPNNMPFQGVYGAPAPSQLASYGE